MCFGHTRLLLRILVALTFLLPAMAVSAPAGKTLPAAIVARDPFTWDHSLTVSAEAAIKRHRQNQGVILVDVRPAEEWSIARIPGAMHIPLAFVETKAFLKGRAIVLLGSGHDATALLAACRDLNAKGFKTRMLSGGIQAWLAVDGPLAGNPAALIPRREMRPEAFYREKNIAGRPVLVFADDSAQAVLDAVMPYAVLVSQQTRPEQIKKITEEALKGSASGANLPLLVCTPDGRDHDRIGARLAQAGVSPVLFLEGGLAAYRTYLFGILQAQRPREDRMKTVGGCQGCGPVDASKEAGPSN